MPPKAKGPRGWAPVNSMRYNILHPYAESYLEHQRNGTLGRFFPNVYKQYFAVFHYTLSDDQDPNPEMVYAEPETDEEKKKKSTLMNVMKNRISRWFYQHYARVRPQGVSISSTASFPPAPSPSSIAKLSVRRTPSLQVYMHMYCDRFRDAVDAQFIIDRSTDLTARRVGTMTRICRDAFEKETPAVIALVEEEVNRRFDKAKAAKQAINETPNASDRYQPCIDGLGLYIKDLFKVLHEHTGWTFTLLAGGPDPSLSGDISVLNVHHGRTIGEHSMDFGTFAVDLYRDQLTKTFVEFLGNVHGVPLAEPIMQARPNLESAQGYPQGASTMSSDSDVHGVPLAEPAMQAHPDLEPAQQHSQAADGDIHGVPLAEPVTQARTNLESAQGHPQAASTMSPNGNVYSGPLAKPVMQAHPHLESAQGLPQAAVTMPPDGSQRKSLLPLSVPIGITSAPEEELSTPASRASTPATMLFIPPIPGPSQGRRQLGDTTVEELTPIRNAENSNAKRKRVKASIEQREPTKRIRKKTARSQGIESDMLVGNKHC